MVVEASITGLFRTILIIIGAIFVLRFLGQLMQAKRNLEAEKALAKKQNDLAKERNQKLRNFGKTTLISKKSKSTKANLDESDIEDAEFEEI